MQVKEKESKYIFTAERQDYMTPPEIYQPILKFIGEDKFAIDVCCSKSNIPAMYYYTINGVFVNDSEDGFCQIMDSHGGLKLSDGLNTGWFFSCWLNPPYCDTDKWVKKAYQEAGKGSKIWSIIPARTETKYWNLYIADNPNCFVVNIRKGVSFIDPETDDYCKSKDGKIMPYKNPLAIVYFGKNAEEYAKRWNQEQPLPYKAWRIAA